jgi:hypothetical protein
MVGIGFHARAVLITRLSQRLIRRTRLVACRIVDAMRTLTAPRFQ